MVDAAYWSHTGQMSRLTRGQLKDFAALSVVGRVAASLDLNDQAVLERLVNQTVLGWKMDLPSIRGYGERRSTETWSVGNTRHELPADFDDLHPSMAGRIVLLDESGNETGQLEVVRVGEYEQAWDDSGNPYSDRDKPVAFLFGTSTNGRRFIEIRPSPSTAIQFRVVYTTLPEVLDNDNDQLEAPLGAHEGIQWDLASAFAAAKGNAKADAFERRAARIRQRFLEPWNDETKRAGRVLSHEEVGGYSYYNRPE